jgi:hypothetical protein
MGPDAKEKGMERGRQDGEEQWGSNGHGCVRIVFHQSMFFKNLFLLLMAFIFPSTPKQQQVHAHTPLIQLFIIFLPL